MKERGKLGKGREEGRDKEGERKGFAYQIDESAVLCHHAPDRFKQVTSVALRRVVPVVCSTSWTSSLNTVIYMHQALDGTPLVADRPFIPTVQVQPRSNSNFP